MGSVSSCKRKLVFDVIAEVCEPVPIRNPRASEKGERANRSAGGFVRRTVFSSLTRQAILVTRQLRDAPSLQAPTLLCDCCCALTSPRRLTTLDDHCNRWLGQLRQSFAADPRATDWQA
eukprot:scaffold895_cov315-Pinguiococcus_pyrenoidosus.AAC.75